MAIYRFRVTFEDYEDIYRDIDMPSKGTFLELHHAIHSSTGYVADASSSFYVSNDQWKKGTEIALHPTPRKVEAGVLLMENIRLSKFIDDPHQKFYYIYNFDRPYDFHVELIKILKEEEGQEYPSIFKSVGQAPKIAAAANFPVAAPEEEDDEEPVEENTEEYGVDEEDDYSVDDGEEEEGESEEGTEDFGFSEDDY
ncbi:plasmid pRiA4b ORF-3 family protein [Parapedobacter sp. SGR-10]|uniref:plasmid pRiA4b ORF-3 family protein n=1 Tax=Parapedobacter sp. SGR-10 TaxID=2710879 RepID=UPI0013D82B88|nr:plasmid pRiA4b ORF-3 family protein [Parapedobacter sp. SGR-10]NGF58168.1 plasmid pRiA4b ORF-3 family protein [Parapedobacter sp. SGR-10]